MKVNLAVLVPNRMGLVSVNFFAAALDEILAAAKKDSVIIGTEKDSFDLSLSANEKVDQARSLAASKFLETTGDVLALVDASVGGWAPGDIMKMSRLAHQERAVVAGICSTSINGGIEADFGKDSAFTPGKDELLPVHRIGARFMAISKDVLRAIRGASSGLGGPFVQRCRLPNGELFYDFFRPLSEKHKQMVDVSEYMGDGYSFCWRAAKAEQKIFAWPKPVLTVDGVFSFTPVHGLLAAQVAGKR